MASMLWDLNYSDESSDDEGMDVSESTAEKTIARSVSRGEQPQTPSPRLANGIAEAAAAAEAEADAEDDASTIAERAIAAGRSAWLAKQIPDDAERSSPWHCYMHGSADGYARGHADAARDIETNAAAAVPQIAMELEEEHGHEVRRAVLPVQFSFKLHGVTHIPCAL